MPTESPISPTRENAGLSGFRQWPAHKKQVAFRFALLGGAYLAFVLTFDLMIWRHGVTTTSSLRSSSGGVSRITYTSGVARSLFQVNPGPVTAILSLEALALLVSTLSLWQRVARSSSKVGVPGVVAASILGVVGMAGMLTVGPSILLLAALLLMVALPMDAISSQ